jgi:hypothetical protein
MKKQKIKYSLNVAALAINTIKTAGWIHSFKGLDKSLKKYNQKLKKQK